LFIGGIVIGEITGYINVKQQGVKLKVILLGPELVKLYSTHPDIGVGVGAGVVVGDGVGVGVGQCPRSIIVYPQF
jgi:hypothetical protein